MWTDSHTHLGSHRFSTDLVDVITRARAAGVSRMLVPATDLANARHCLAIAEIQPDIRVAVGVHPCDVDQVPPGSSKWIHELRALAQHPQVAAIGEIGLDYFHPPPAGFTLDSWRAHQAHCLLLQLELAAELGLNVVLHNRESWADLIHLVQPFHGQLRAVFHCFTGTLEEALSVISAGHLVSFTGIVTFKNPGHMAAVARAVPMGSFMLETDAPYLAPMPHRGTRCEPAHLCHTGQFIATLRGVSAETLAAETRQTAEQFFRGFTAEEV
jgi:TatD DNase family protein